MEFSSTVGCSALPRPTFLVFLTSPPQSQGIGGNCLRDYGAGGEVRAGPYLDRRNERGVAADKGAIADFRGMFFQAIVIASDGSCPDIDLLADV